MRIGGNKNEEKLLSVINEKNLSNFVSFEGWVSGDKKIALLNWGDIFVLPSYNEGLPISILEAMSYKMPIISTAVGGLPEVVDVENGTLVRPGDAEGIYNAIRGYLNNTDRIEAQGKVSYERSKAYMPDCVIRDLRCIYVELLSV
jgi:glycosyltransferase involved in cell wall biosynthesis